MKSLLQVFLGLFSKRFMLLLRAALAQQIYSGKQPLSLRRMQTQAPGFEGPKGGPQDDRSE
ncbi:MAG: hypothetical protein P8Z31_12770 [Gammaproteobacteria bacterium]|jgi:hypothetical protein